MNSRCSFEDIRDEIGDKALDAIVVSVSRTRDDLADYRAARPHYVADASERGLANWIHDRVWAHLRAELDGLADFFLLDNGSTREVTVKSRFRLRVKRHDAVGAVANYPTLAALDFFGQPTQLAFDGLDEIHLIGGYEWDPISRDVGVPVLSLRDGANNVLWIRDLTDPAVGLGLTAPTAAVQPILPAEGGPAKPVITVVTGNDDVEESNES